MCVADIDECATISGICGDGECLNGEGSYTCVCPKGYVSTSGGAGCQGNGNTRRLGRTNLYLHGFFFFVFFLLHATVWALCHRVRPSGETACHDVRAV